MKMSCEALQLSESYRANDETETFFFCCTSCKKYLPNHVCVITPDRPSPCGISWISAERRPDFYIRIEKGAKIGFDEYLGVNSAFEEFTGGEVSRVKLHSVLNYPPPSGLLQQLIVFYIPENDSFGIIDKKYPGKTPVGLTFKEMEKSMIGKQMDGFVGASYSYLKSNSFLAGEGGWERITWVSPNVEKFLRMKSFAIG
jgi:acetyl-CoA decarbonylase/synthase complex subunit beta